MRRYLIAVTILICVWFQWTHSTSTHPDWYVSDITRIMTGEAESPYRTRILLPSLAWVVSGGEPMPLYTSLVLIDLAALAAALVSLYMFMTYVVGGERAFTALLFAEFVLVTFVVYGGGFTAWSWFEMAVFNVGLRVIWGTLRLPRWLWSRP